MQYILFYNYFFIVTLNHQHVALVLLRIYLICVNYLLRTLLDKLTVVQPLKDILVLTVVFIKDGHRIVS